MEKNIHFNTEAFVIRQLKDSGLYHKYSAMRNSSRKLFMDFCTGKSLKALTYDNIFKKIFDFQTNPQRLEHFLSALLGFSVNVVKILPSEGERLIESGSVMIMDILVKLEDGSIINVEMQKRPYKFSGKRDSCYVSDLIMRQYNELKAKARNEDSVFTYQDMKPVYTIIILEHSYLDMLNHKDVWEHIGKIRFNDGLQMDCLENIIYIRLDNFKKLVENITTEKEKWIYLLSADTSEEVLKAASFSEEMFHIVADVSKFVLNTERVMDMFSEALYMLDRNTEKLMYDEAIEDLERTKKDLSAEKKRAEQEKLNANIFMMLYQGKDISEIIQKCKVSEEYIVQLINTMPQIN